MRSDTRQIVVSLLERAHWFGHDAQRLIELGLPLEAELAGAKALGLQICATDLEGRLDTRDTTRLRVVAHAHRCRHAETEAQRRGQERAAVIAHGQAVALEEFARDLSQHDQARVA